MPSLPAGNVPRSIHGAGDMARDIANSEANTVS
jgi:hypothetical protein